MLAVVLSANAVKLIILFGVVEFGLTLMLALLGILQAVTLTVAVVLTLHVPVPLMAVTEYV